VISGAECPQGLHRPHRRSHSIEQRCARESRSKEAGACGCDVASAEALGICNRFTRVARQLLHRRENRSTLESKDEYDVQDLLHALLQIYFDDIRPEEWTPSYGGGSSRMDFLKDHAIVVEVKMTRTGLGCEGSVRTAHNRRRQVSTASGLQNPRRFCVRPVGFGQESSRNRARSGYVVRRRVRCDMRYHAINWILIRGNAQARIVDV